MKKIKENLQLFFTIWGVVLFLNQIIIFHGCLQLYCLAAALPHTGIVSFILLIFFINNDKKNIKIDEDKKSNPQNITKLSPVEIQKLPYSFDVHFKITLIDISPDIFKIKIDNDEYFITKPNHNSWKDKNLKNGDKCIVKKILHNSKVWLYLIEISDEKLIKSYEKDITVLKDSEVENLKLELKSLEEKLQNLAIEKTEYLNDIEEFNIQYNIHLGDIIKSILLLKKEILYKKTIKYKKLESTYKEEIKTFYETKDTITELKETISELEEALENIDFDDENYDEIYKAYQELQEELENLENELYSQEQKLNATKEQLEDDEVFNEYEDVKSAYEDFKNEYEHIKDTQKDIIKLNDEQKIEIKKLYKKAARLCHPDIVSKELKEKAHEIMQVLNDAYSKKNIIKIKEILLKLETGTSVESLSNRVENKEILKAKIEEFKKTIQELKNEIEEIKSDDTFVIISSIDDWDAYFEEIKNELKVEKEKLLHEILDFVDTVKYINDEEIIVNTSKNVDIKKEDSKYSKYIQSIENIRFEKIRKYCENLSKENDADTMQRHLGEQGKMYKALMYSTLEVFLEKLSGETITLCDWGCGQGIASMLVLDYIKEKQLDIKVSDVILIDDDTKALGRAMAQVEALAQNSIKFIPTKSDDNNISDTIKSNKNNIVLNLFANDKIPISFWTVNYDIFGESYFLCVSNENKEFVDELYENINSFIDVENLSILDGKIGKFDKYERIFRIKNQ
jgi:hypothetical protein